MEIQKILNIIDNRIKELDMEAVKHCFKRGKMCSECWEKKVLLIKLKEKFANVSGGDE